MTSPVSIGDAIVLSQLAYTIGRAFSSGHKSAPAEFHEVQNQLFALGGALGLLANDRTEEAKSRADRGSQPSKPGYPMIEQDEVLQQMILNCKETLTHLEALVKKYMDIDPNAKTLNQTIFSSWKQDVKKNWKKIKWTTEGGDLDKLRNNLTVHINGLNLAMSAMHSTQTQKVEAKVNEVHNMLEEIHNWYEKNLKAAEMPPPKSKISKEPPPNNEAEPQLTFEIHIELPKEAEINLICPRASFMEGWLSNTDGWLSQGLFRCHCRLNNDVDASTISHRGPDHSADLRFSLLPATLIVQLASPQNLWQLHVLSRASNGWVSLIIGGIAPSSLAAFTEQVDLLATHQSRQLYNGGSNSMLMHFFDSEFDEELRILAAKSDVRDLNGQIATTTFVKEGYKFNQNSMGAVELLRYRTIPTQALQPVDGSGCTRSYLQDYSELILRPQDKLKAFSDPGILQYVIRIKRNTQISQPKTNLICISAVECTAEKAGANADYIPSLDIQVLFKAASAARKFSASIAVMQRELLVSYYRFPQPGERIAFQRSTGDLMVQDFYLPNTMLTVTFDPVANEHRMILLSCCTSMCVSMKLPALFFATAKTNTEYPAYFVKIGWDTTTVVERYICPWKLQCVSEISH